MIPLYREQTKILDNNFNCKNSKWCLTAFYTHPSPCSFQLSQVEQNIHTTEMEKLSQRPLCHHQLNLRLSILWLLEQLEMARMVLALFKDPKATSHVFHCIHLLPMIKGHIVHSLLLMVLVLALFSCAWIDISSPFYQHGLTLVPAWISYHMHSKVWDGITYPFLNFNGCTVEV